MTDEELAKIVARAEKATPGPWRAASWSPSEGGWLVVDDTNGWILWSAANAAFIAAARTDVPRLAAELRRAREALRAVLAHPYATDCQECGIGQADSVTWQKVRAALEEPSDG